MEFKSIDEIIEFAIKREEEAFNLYEKLKQRTDDAAVRKVFEELAGEERKHKQKLLDFREGKVFLTPKSEKVPDLKISDRLVKVELKEDFDIQDALIFAMNREKLSFTLYMQLSEKADNPDAKSILISLAQEEAKHKLKLELIYDDYYMQ